MPSLFRRIFFQEPKVEKVPKQIYVADLLLKSKADDKVKIRFKVPVRAHNKIHGIKLIPELYYLDLDKGSLKVAKNKKGERMSARIVSNSILNK